MIEKSYIIRYIEYNEWVNKLVYYIVKKWSLFDRVNIHLIKYWKQRKQIKKKNKYWIYGLFTLRDKNFRYF